MRDGNAASPEEIKRLWMWAAVMLVVPVVGLIFVWAVSFWANKSLIVFRNESALSVTDIHVEVCGQRLAVAALAPGTSKEVSFHIRGDGDFNIEARVGDQVKTLRNAGYVTNGVYDSSSTIRITPQGEIDLNQSQ